jgi:hypothetical protein
MGKSMSRKIDERLNNLCGSLELYGESEAVRFIKESFFGIFKSLRLGSRGQDVRRIQNLLINKGFKLPRFGVDGVFGTETEAAVKEFQQVNQLRVDGVVGDETISKLDPTAVINTQQIQETEEKPVVVEDEPMTPFSMQRFKPFSAKARRLFRRATTMAGVPKEWADSEGLHSILQKESDGWVGIPNYTYGRRAADSKYWGQVHEEIKAGKMATSSGATGLGQLQPRNIDRFYPSGRNGIGDPLEEAIGMLLYIKERYGSPDGAWSVYGYKAEKTDPDTGSVFTEGY